MAAWRAKRYIAKVKEEKKPFILIICQSGL
jgi:hypothetical protein